MGSINLRWHREHKFAFLGWSITRHQGGARGMGGVKSILHLNVSIDPMMQIHGFASYLISIRRTIWYRYHAIYCQKWERLRILGKRNILKALINATLICAALNATLIRAALVFVALPYYIRLRKDCIERPWIYEGFNLRKSM